MKKKLLIPIIIAILMMIPSLVFADEGEISAAVASAIDNVWVLVAAFLVFFMQAGFAMVEAGFTRAKNSSNIIMKNMMDVAIGSIAYFVIGFGIIVVSTSERYCLIAWVSQYELPKCQSKQGLILIVSPYLYGILYVIGIITVHSPILKL